MFLYVVELQNKIEMSQNFLIELTYVILCNDVLCLMLRGLHILEVSLFSPTWVQFRRKLLSTQFGRSHLS